MIRSLRTGVSGIRSNQVRMDVVGNNIANVNTIAFKRTRAAFQEMLGQELVGSGRASSGSNVTTSSVGLGVSVGSIDQNWGQGALEATNIKTDLALNGDGFFVAKNGDMNQLTRAGNFTFNADGELVTSTGLQLQGWRFEDGQLQTGALEDVKIDMNATAPSKVTENVFFGGNLSADVPLIRSTQVDVEGTLETTNVAYDAAIPAGVRATKDVTVYDINGDTYTLTLNFDSTTTNDEYDLNWSLADESGAGVNGGTVAGLTPGSGTPATLADIFGTGEMDLPVDISGLSTVAAGTPLGSASTVSSALANGDPNATVSTSSVVYDQAGRAHTLGVDFRRVGSNAWRFQVKDLDSSPATLLGETGAPGNTDFVLAFNPDGTIDSASSTGLNANNELAIDWAIGGATESITLNMAGPTNLLAQTAGSTTVSGQSQDGYPSGTLQGFGFTGNGVLQLNFSNGQNQDIYQLAIGTVSNPNGLKQLGENMYGVTSGSGDVQMGRAGHNLRTRVQAGTLEMSNVDLATEFTDMIVTQRGFQAAARVITTSDEILQETMQLKR